jgi:uncharacterized protein
LDPAHDFAHFQRVVRTAKKLAIEEGAEMAVVVPAAWLHDLVNLPKNDPRRSQASRLSAVESEKVLREMGYPESYLPGIMHAIEAHSYSANIQTTSLEAAIVQDADRLDGLGAIGIARVFSVGGLLKRRIYSEEDLFGERGRTLDDLKFTVDHFFVKLFKTVETLKTSAGKKEGERRAKIMRSYLESLRLECDSGDDLSLT